MYTVWKYSVFWSFKTQNVFIISTSVKQKEHLVSNVENPLPSAPKADILYQLCPTDRKDYLKSRFLIV